MNRAERRKAGVKGKGKTYVFNSREALVSAALNGPGKKAMDKEIDRQLLERLTELEHDIDAAVLWALHVSCGFGPKRLIKFFKDLVEIEEEMRRRFEDEDCYAERMKLKEMGVDVIALRKEVRGDGEQ